MSTLTGTVFTVFSSVYITIDEGDTETSDTVSGTLSFTGRVCFPPAVSPLTSM